MFKSFKNLKSLFSQKNPRTHAPKYHGFHMEQLEARELLSAVPLSTAEYADLREQYADFNLPENMTDINVITLDLAQGDDITDLENAITKAENTTQSDLIVLRTTKSASKLTCAGELLINIDATQSGSISIVGLGSKNCTLDAQSMSCVMAVSGESTIANLGGLTITNGNSMLGGGIHNYENATLTVMNCTFSGNVATTGGGIFNESGITNIKDCTISGNSAKLAGAGISNNKGEVTVTNCTISENSISGDCARYGSGIYNEGTFTVINSCISENTVSGDDVSGGGICNRGTLTATNCTLSGNSVSGQTISGDGIYNSSTLTINNTIIVDAIFKEESSVISGSNNLSVFTDWDSGENNLVYDSDKPLFMDAAKGNYQLTTGSQAIDKGENSLAVDTDGEILVSDLAGKTRIVEDIVDIGAYEYQGGNFDIDGNGIVDLLTDGLLINRYMCEYTGEALTFMVIGDGATRTTPEEITEYLDSIHTLLDIDGNGEVDLLTDGLLLNRYLAEYTGEALIQKVIGEGATRTTADEISEYIVSFIPSEEADAVVVSVPSHKAVTDSIFDDWSDDEDDDWKLYA